MNIAVAISIGRLSKFAILSLVYRVSFEPQPQADPSVDFAQPFGVDEKRDDKHSREKVIAKANGRIDLVVSVNSGGEARQAHREEKAGELSVPKEPHVHDRKALEQAWKRVALVLAGLVAMEGVNGAREQWRGSQRLTHQRAELRS